MFVIAWEYLGGRAVATDPSDRKGAEWPPHPDRVFQSLVASWGERGEDAEERSVLNWLAGLAPPQVAVPMDADEAESGHAIRCSVPPVYVPVNDLNGPKRGNYSKKLLALFPDNRTRTKRCFPSVHVGQSRCALIWPETDLPEAYQKSFARICAGVTYLGHSSSLVRMWFSASSLADNVANTNGAMALWVPVDAREGRDLSLRVPDAKRLDTLIAAFAGGGRGWRRPPTARWQGYRRAGAVEAERKQGHFDDRLIILRQVEGPRLHLAQTLRLTEALHKTLLKKSDGWTPERVSGHEADGSPSRQNHVSILPLAHVGREHADGHLLGLALAMPRGLAWEEEEIIYRTIATAMGREEGSIRLTLGSLGVVTVAVEDRPAPPFALRPGTWCRPATCWGTVTPIVLDRFPPRGIKDCEAWAAGQIVSACARQELPEPVEIGIMPLSVCLGAPSARAIPPMVRKDGARRWHTHAVITFAEPVVGPLILGAGRFRGYGLCRPLARGKQA